MRDIGNRIAWLTGALAVALLLMGFQLYRLTIVQAAFWRTQAAQNMVRELPSYGPRGAIYDRKCRPLALSAPARAAVLVDQEPSHVEKFLPTLAGLLTAGNEKQAQEIMKVVRERMARNQENLMQFEPLVIRRNLSDEIVAKFTERQSEFPGVKLVLDSTRVYPEKSLGGHVLGYVRSISEEKLKDKDFADYNPDEVVGELGLEQYWEHELRGTPGTKSLIVDQLGKPVGDYKLNPAQPGHDLKLTLDADLQRVAEEALAKQMAYIAKLPDSHAEPVRGALVVEDVRTGAILAMAAVPTYDPNVMVRDLTTSQLQAIENQPGFSWDNPAIIGFAPGSTYKMATGLAGLQSGKVGPNERIECPDGIWFGGRFWKNWTYNQGPADIARALAISCNPFFYTVGQRVGIDGLAAFNKQFGFGKLTGIDLAGEQPGVLPTEASYGNRWEEGQNLNVAIGQGDVMVTPLQLADYIATIANSGVRHQPYLVQQVLDASGKVLLEHQLVTPSAVTADPANWKRIQDGLWLGSQSWEGTAALPFKGFPIKTGAKTGSAEFFTTGFPHALSVAYAPFDKPEIAVSVVIEGGGTGSWTTPVIRRVMAAYFGIENDVIPPEVVTYH